MGFSLTWGVLNIINIAHGAMVMLGAYATWWLFARLGVDPFLSLPISMGLMFVLGYLLQWIGHRIEGNDVGEFIPIKKLLGLPVVAIAPQHRSFSRTPQQS